MPLYFYGFDQTYLFLVLPCLILSLWASANVISSYLPDGSQARKLPSGYCQPMVWAMCGSSGSAAI